MTPPSATAVLLVDGYNIIGVWSDLQVIRDRDGMEAARHQLIESLVNYSSFQGYETQVVFDAHFRDTKGVIESVTQNLCVCYTDFGQTADTFIEKTCAAYSRDILKPRLIVATSDRAQQLTVVGYGAEWMSAQKLALEIEATTALMRRRHRPKKQPSSRFLSHSLDAKARERFAAWRMGKTP